MARVGRTLVAVSAVALLAIAVPQAARQTGGVTERFTAVAINMGNFGPAQAGPVEIVFNLIELEDYALQPVRLTSVRSVRTPSS